MSETEIQIFEDLIHEALESSGGVSQAEGHVRVFEKAESCDICLFMSSRWTGI